MQHVDDELSVDPVGLQDQPLGRLKSSRHAIRNELQGGGQPVRPRHVAEPDVVLQPLFLIRVIPDDKQVGGPKPGRNVEYFLQCGRYGVTGEPDCFPVQDPDAAVFFLPDDVPDQAFVPHARDDAIRCHGRDDAQPYGVEPTGHCCINEFQRMGIDD